jgi:hypothetical protein
MQKERIDRPFFKYFKFLTSQHGLRIQKTIERYNEVIKSSGNNAFFLLKKISPYVFSGFSITFIIYLLINFWSNYPPREIGISP